MRRGSDVDTEVVCRLIVGSMFCVATCASAITALAACPDGREPIYLTFDTGSQSQAMLVHDVLKKHGVHATFFLANEKTIRGDSSLDPSWAAYWKMLASEGHAFGTHTFDHVYYRGDVGDDEVRVRPQFGPHAGQTMVWDATQYCAELDRVSARFTGLTGQRLDAFWRAPGGKTSARLIAFGRSCGYRHFGWSAAGFLGDELPSEQYPNAMLLKRALRTIKAGDIVMAHLGIRSRKEPLAPILDPLISGLEAEGHCFATLRDYPRDRPT
jgi:peptidoglycan/xylan/chitin deacetylase (PgdA/CDA1 family)